MKWIHWLKPGLQLKRWILIGVLGLLLISIPAGHIVVYFFDIHWMIMVLFGVAGCFLFGVAFKRGFTSLLKNLQTTPFTQGVHRNSKHIQRMIYDKQVLAKGRKVVVIGGGTGLSILLRGLKQMTSNITAVVTVADDGGGSGILREDLGMLPPGDIRSCILALSEMEPTMENLLQYRFQEGSLKGQSFGNLFIASMNGISGSFEEAIKKMNEVLAVKGQVYPVTLENITLYAQLKNGKIIKGESKIPEKSLEEDSPIDFVFLRPKKASTLPEILNAIQEADAIVLGPGSLYTSIIPNLLINPVAESINKSKATTFYLPNIMTQPGETDQFSVRHHVEALLKNTGLKRIDYVIANKEKVPVQIEEKYALEGAKMVLPDENDKVALKEQQIHLVEEDLVEIKNDYVRHDAYKTSKFIEYYLSN
ncbi:gluconeogenesis factor YvcK family protein [Tindallia californiensis]|uniref:Putative gluconeogenesis factor n=1 Tax=Tindallia californiensis TaxID=159292 RepID=A0A1H3K0U7_9FIRM|nr:gluconeogenesis factor YvcK family protein [Tindallia californiensis]SDY45797.1 conserved hypothetical protein, cofD-related [Tindallia californiensis]